MAVITVPDSLVEQPGETRGLQGGTRTFTRSFKGPWANVKSFANGIEEGDTLSGYPVAAVAANRVSGDYGEVTLSLSAESSTTEAGTRQAERAAWSIRQARNDVSILAYCGNGASRVNLELWMKEADAELARGMMFHKTESETEILSSTEQTVANKILQGVESVMRFYPVLSCASTWPEIPPTFASKVGFIDEPAAPTARKTVAPGDLASVIAAHSWLKVQDDVSETTDGKWRRQESWMGIKKSLCSAGWDQDLYGESGWPMPLSGADTSGAAT